MYLRLDFPAAFHSPDDPIIGHLGEFGGEVLPMFGRTNAVELAVFSVCIVLAYLALMYFGHSLDHQKRLAKRRPQPPIRAEFALYLILNGPERDAAVGDLIERYPEVVKRYGKRKADLWAWSQVLRSIGPIVRRFITIGGLLTAAAIIKKVLGQK